MKAPKPTIVAQVPSRRIGNTSTTLAAVSSHGLTASSGTSSSPPSSVCAAVGGGGSWATAGGTAITARLSIAARVRRACRPEAFNSATPRRSYGARSGLLARDGHWRPRERNPYPILGATASGLGRGTLPRNPGGDAVPRATKLASRKGNLRVDSFWVFPSTDGRRIALRRVSPALHPAAAVLLP